MIIDELIKHPGSWLSVDERPRVVLSSRVRLARNLRGAPFPARAKPDERVRVCEQVRETCQRIDSLDQPMFFDMGALAPVDKTVLKERRLISRELAEKAAGSGLVIDQDEHTAIMINEEDHLRLQAISAGEDLLSVWRKVDRVDSDLEQYLPYAFSPRLGYLTSCPTNVGTGLRASVMMHLPGLYLLDEVDAVMRGLNKIGLAVRGLFGEGSEANGNLYQVSNQITLGQGEEEIVQGLTELVAEVSTHEHHARQRLMESQRGFLLDRIGRAFGVLSHARLVSSGEMVELLSVLRLGVEFGMVTGLNIAEINELLLRTQPGHLQKLAGQNLSHNERDELRGTLGRKRLKNVKLRVT